MSYVRVNYRKTGARGGNLAFNELASVLVRFCTSIEHNSESGGVCTVSMSGYGVPIWIYMTLASEPAGAICTFVNLRYSYDQSTSFVYTTFQGWTGSYNSLAATVSMGYHIIALIGSR